MTGFRLFSAGSEISGNIHILFFMLIKVHLYFILFLKIIYLFLERGEGREKEGEKHQCVLASQVVAPTRDLACNPGMCPDWELNRRPFGLQPALNLLSYTGQGYSYFLIYIAVHCCGKLQNHRQPMFCTLR